MAQPTTRQELIDYCKRKLGAPVLEINVADEQIDDLVDDAIQLFQERHFDGVYPTFYKYKITQNDIDRVLELEKRHFGALAGQGLVNIQLQNYEKAIKSYQMAEEIYPAMKSPKLMIKQIEELIKKQSI